METRFIIIVLLVSFTSSKGMEYYASLERIYVNYTNPEYVSYMNMTAKRPGRWDNRHYAHCHFRIVKTIDNSVKVDVLFYEFRSNEYRRGFVEMHFSFCDLVLKDKFFGPAARANLPGCPILPNEYHMHNMTIPDLPVLGTFPFSKGRIYMTFSRADVRIFAFHIDMEIKTKTHAKSKARPENKAALVTDFNRVL